MNNQKYKNISFEKRINCVVCDKKVDSPLIELPDFPITEIYTNKLPNEKLGFVDQSFHFCRNCGHGQLNNVINLELQYGGLDNYHFRTSESATAREHTDFFLKYFNQFVKDSYFKTIVEIGCNDLYLLKSLKSKADKLIGIDPILKAREKEFSEDNIVAIGDFFGKVSLTDPIDVVICKDTLEHVSDPKQMIKKVVDMSSDKTLFFFQFPLLDALLMGGRFDQIYHQHLNYFSLKSITFMLNELNCQLVDYTINFNHFGSIIVVFKKNKSTKKQIVEPKNITSSTILECYSMFEKNMDATRDRLSSLKGELLYGYGAALMLPVLSYHLNNDFSDLECIIDDDKGKNGLYYINLPVPIKLGEQISDLSDATILITAISSMSNVRKILSRLFVLKPKQIILPLNTI